MGLQAYDTTSPLHESVPSVRDSSVGPKLEGLVYLGEYHEMPIWRYCILLGLWLVATLAYCSPPI